jgi:hypothetical protein
MESSEPREPIFVVDNTIWQWLQRDWGYPTIVGCHSELAGWESGLRDLAERILATIPYLESDLAGGRQDEDLQKNVKYTAEMARRVKQAAGLLESVYEMALARFST